MGKKLGFGIIGLILIAAAYSFFTHGSAQIIENAKQHLNTQLATLEQSGFSIKERKSEKKTDHFVISFDDPQKVSRYLNTQGAEMTQEEAEALKGLQVGVDAAYLPDSYSALSLDLYPTALPKSMMEDLGDEDKKLIAAIKKMLKEKAFLIHIDFNKMLSGFKGYVKDINKTVTDDGESVNIAANGMTFKGDIQQGKVHTFSQKIALISLDAGKALEVNASNIVGGYSMTGKTPYDITSHYQIRSVWVQAEPSFSLNAENIENETKNSVHNGLLKSTIRTKAEKIAIAQAQQKDTIERVRLDFNVDHLDIAVLEALQKTDPEDEAHIQALTQQLLSKGITLTLSDFSAGRIIQDGTAMDGFDMNGSLSVDSTFNAAAASQNPLLALDALHVQTHVSISNELYALMVQDPRAMIMMMMLPPASQKGKKIYDIHFSKGKLSVNGKPIL